MLKTEIDEVKKQLTPAKSSIDRIVGCYVNGEEKRIADFSSNYLALDELDVKLYSDLLKKGLSGNVGKTLFPVEFDKNEMKLGGKQDSLIKIVKDGFRTDAMREAFFDNIIASYTERLANYMILAVHNCYDVPVKGTDNDRSESDEVYEYIQVIICPVEAQKTQIIYNPKKGGFEPEPITYVVKPPTAGFLYPAFDERCTNIQSALYYSKSSKALDEGFINAMFGTSSPLSAEIQKKAFIGAVEESLGEVCNLETIKDIHNKLNELSDTAEEGTDDALIDKEKFKNILKYTGADEEMAEQCYENNVQQEKGLNISNLYNKSLNIETEDVVVKVKNGRNTDILKEDKINGAKCLVIRLEGLIEVNGIAVK